MGLYYPQEQYIAEGTHTACSIPFTVKERRKDIPGFFGAIFCHHLFDAKFGFRVPLNYLTALQYNFSWYLYNTTISECRLLQLIIVLCIFLEFLELMCASGKFLKFLMDCCGDL